VETKMGESNWILHHDNVSPSTGSNLGEEPKSRPSFQQLYSPDLTPCDFVASQDAKIGLECNFASTEAILNGIWQLVSQPCQRGLPAMAWLMEQVYVQDGRQ
jgi:hypothetical protein